MLYLKDRGGTICYILKTGVGLYAIFICFNGEILLINPKVSLLPLLIRTTEFSV